MRTFAVTVAQGTGNDFILLENPSRETLPYAALARKWCRRRHDIGADGLLVIEPPTARGADIALRIFNADGSEAEMCGNGIRCIAVYLADERPSLPDRLAVQTSAGLVTTRMVRGQAGAASVAVDMGTPRFLRREIPMRGDRDERALDAEVDAISGGRRISALSMGNPHCVTFADEPVERLDLIAHVKALERLDLFPHGANYEVVHADNGSLSMRIFERGVGETRACGSGACAAAVAAIATGRARSPVEVRMPGGTVVIEWPADDANVIMTGPAEIVCRAEASVEDAEFESMLAADRP